MARYLFFGLSVNRSILFLVCEKLNLPIVRYAHSDKNMNHNSSLTQNDEASSSRNSEDQSNTENSPSRVPRKKYFLALARAIWLPLLGMVAVLLAFFSIGWMQRAGYLQPVVEESQSMTLATSTTRYICPMMCVEPTLEPGRCPVCEMELVPAESGPVFIDPAMRRILNIKTVRVERQPPTWIIRSVGGLSYDESRLTSIAAYVPGRIEKMYVNFTGMDVTQGQPLATIYSPELFVAQQELLLSKRNLGSSSSLNDASNRLYESSRQRLIELGMSSQQIAELEQTGRPTSRLEVLAPIGGTVIERLAVEGQYVAEGQVVYRLADLSRVWLQLQLFPSDASLVHVDQMVEAEVDSIPGERFSGRVAFVSPTIDPNTRTVDVRVEINNPQRRLRIGDFARAIISTEWKRETEHADQSPVVVPREAVLLAGSSSVVYLETEPGRFEIQPVTIGAISDRQAIIVSGLNVGDKVVTRGNFLIDSQMQLAGNPSLIDPSQAQPKDDELTDEMLEAIDQLDEPDRTAAMEQKLCIVADFPLGSMGVPIKVEVEGVGMFICCEGCRNAILNDPQKHIDKLRSWQRERQK